MEATTMPEEVWALGRRKPTPTGISHMTWEVVRDAATIIRLREDDEKEPHPDRKGMTKGEVVVYDEALKKARQLAGATTSVVEWEMCEALATTWWELKTMEGVYWKHINNGQGSKEWECRSRCVDRLRRRYAQLLKALADVRKLAAPVLINVQQMNVAAGPQQVVNEASNSPVRHS